MTTILLEVPAWWYAAGGAALLLLAGLSALVRRGRRPAPRAAEGYEVLPAAQVVALKQAVRTAREEADALKARCAGNEKLLLLLPECTKQLVNVWLPEGNIPNVATRQVKSLLDPDTVAVFLVDPSSGALVLAGGFGLPPSVLAGAGDRAGNRAGAGAGDRAPVVVESGEGLVGMAAQSGVLVDRATFEYQRAQGRGAPGRERLRLDLAAPVLSQDERLGVIAIGGSRQATDYQRWLLTMVAELTAVAILTSRSRQDMSRDATTDALTGLFNRRYLMERLTAELKRAEAYGTPLSLILYDVDNFKHYNDRNGHPAGDACLKLVAKATRDVTRGQDFVARYGGEEFVVVTLGADKAHGARHAERVREAIVAADIEHAAAQPLGCVSASLGVSTFPEDGRTPEDLLAAADRALYKAKQSGRNRVMLAEPEYLGDESQLAASAAFAGQMSQPSS